MNTAISPFSANSLRENILYCFFASPVDPRTIAFDSRAMGRKRKNEETTTGVGSTTLTKTDRPSSTIVGISRTIAACQRCRQKKTKCDQQFPACSRCAKAGIECVGLDPATGRQVPRSYIIYLEDKINNLEKLLKEKGISPEDSPALSSSNPTRINSETPLITSNNSKLKRSSINDKLAEDGSIKSSLNLSVPSSDSSGLSFYIGDSSGISFAKLLFTAVKFHPSSINENNSITTRVPKNIPTAIITDLPSKSVAELLIKSYFEQSNTQLPVLHREFFIDNYFKPIYGNLSPDIKLASNYTKMNLNTSPINLEDTFYYHYQTSKLNILTMENTPEELHKPLFFLFLMFAISTSINLLQYSPETSNSYKKQAMEFIESIYQSDDRLECVQGLLLLTLYSIMRPSTPGVWYVLGTTLRLCVDLGLHTEKLNDQFSPFVKDLRRRLFWCAYSLDRQICVYLGRPFGIPEESISTKFPVDLDDCLINLYEKQDFVCPVNSLPTYKTISINFFKIRRIQAEILQVLYFSGSSLPRYYQSFNEWKLKMDNQLDQWYKQIPLKTSRKANSNFNFEFFKLNYYHSKLLLFGVTPKNSRPNNATLQILFEASKGIINCYSELFQSKAINYTWSAVHNLFMAGTSFFYSIYNSPENLIDLPEFEKSNRIVIEVLNSLVQTCEAASPCVEIFEILSLAMVRLKFENNMTDMDLKSSDFDEIQRFFEKLKEETPTKLEQYPLNGDMSQQPTGQTPDDLYYSSLSTPPQILPTTTAPVVNDLEQQKIFEMMNQVSNDAIWDQFIGGM